MRDRLVASLGSRFLLVAGKGGVGKSTTAAALAVHLADRGLRTHLVSTDPAHSIGDIFGQPVGGGAPTPIPCAAALTVEEFDAHARAERWFAGVREAVAELVDRGTYLDREDVALFLDHALPGMDEVMAALRIAELRDDAAFDRIVVDTAPTGHTLRMLHAGDTLQGWLTALDAMADKAAAVGVALTGRRVRLAGEAVMDDLSERISRFDDAMRTRSDFVVVTRADAVVSAETARLVDGLHARGLPVRALVSIGAAGGEVRTEAAGYAATAAMHADVPAVLVPFRSDLVGCEGLRKWGTAPGPSPAAELADAPVALHAPPPPTASRSAGSCAAAMDALAGREIVFFAGKGGVGKSTCAAAFALSVAGPREVLLVSLDPAGSLGDVFRRTVDADDACIAPGLRARQLDADRALTRFRERYHERLHDVFRRLGLDRSVPLDRRVLESLLDMAPPGLDEVFALDSILDGPGGHDVLVVDTAPTGHFLRLLEMPATALAWTRSVLRILLRYRAVLGLDDFAAELLGFARRLRTLVERLSDPRRVAVVIVTLAAALPRLETNRLLGALHAAGTAVGAVIENRWSAPTSGASAEPRDPGVAGTPEFRAPWVDPPPVGTERLLAFAGAWACR